MTGTPGWIRPEHDRTSESGPEGDMFAWGALVAYAATGRVPFGTRAPESVASACSPVSPTATECRRPEEIDDGV
ncbi:serine/threonine protein kinase, partial [Streptomyces sp. NPDC127079]